MLAEVNNIYNSNKSKWDSVAISNSLKLILSLVQKPNIIIARDPSGKRYECARIGHTVARTMCLF